jgi:UDP-glucose 4-epimerase
MDELLTPIDGIVHLAATPSVIDSWLHPVEAHQNNLSAIVHVIELCQRLKVPRLVFASSAAVYGSQVALPISEAQQTVPISPYGLQKLVCEQYADLFAKKLGIACISLRLFNVFGDRQLPNSPYSGVISVFANAMQTGKPITIYGDGTQTRDFIYVKDVAAVFHQALIAPVPSDSCLTCNIGTGKVVSLIQLVDILKHYFPEWKSDIRFAPARMGDIQHSQADITKAISVLKFKPEWSIQSSISHFVHRIRPSVSERSTANSSLASFEVTYRI